MAGFQGRQAGYDRAVYSPHGAAYGLRGGQARPALEDVEALPGAVNLAPRVC